MSDTIKCHPENGNQWFFRRQMEFIANENLANERSESFVKPRLVPEHDIWRKPPPDFSVKLYTSLNLPKKPKEREKRVKKNIKNKTEIYNQVNTLQSVDRLPRIMDKESSKFLTRFKNIGEFEAKLWYVKCGKYPKEQFKDSKPHDFRQYEVGIPDFVTSYYHDPLNLQFKSQHLSCVYGIQPLQEKIYKSNNNIFITHRPEDLAWDSALILPKTPWPPKSASFTRYRRQRGVHTAFLDRVEEKFKKWQEKTK
ncbi:Hypothetical predicted protein [Pelobates cultripes]|uniref:Uncharacterized protein n=1 Tax=Pelobates cultripes TaxID=61616 RepID=A0AAD1W127_PELCU|nr:Hypothetical predicted protein [Pelobates cultripes]